VLDLSSLSTADQQRLTSRPLDGGDLGALYEHRLALGVSPDGTHEGWFWWHQDVLQGDHPTRRHPASSLWYCFVYDSSVTTGQAARNFINFVLTHDPDALDPHPLAVEFRSVRSDAVDLAARATSIPHADSLALLNRLQPLADDLRTKRESRDDTLPEDTALKSELARLRGLASITDAEIRAFLAVFNRRAINYEQRIRR